MTTERIAALNDDLRRNIWFPGKNKVVLTAGLASDQKLAADAIAAVRAYDDFTTDSDPHGEHDMGFLEVRGTKIMWKIDYYDNDLTWHSPDPAAPLVTIRVLTIMLASEY
ncbi:DUF3768 domain-containing protein [Paracoccus versutus]|uniref:DUF3768 domain-containing protein n=1 Tax=Paracoccus versutus TaxID=34007 RepID=UPI001FB72691|nr:DUF3768 domain-containing protein [Paracoccus versutus]MCJ1903189.1 DUF3768 domain-containing protein [Paracoccus versutus]